MAENRILRNNILSKGIRLDGRLTHEIRSMNCQTKLFPMVHGSALFEKGETQSLCTATIGSGVDRHTMPDLFNKREKRLVVHYSLPNYATNQIRRVQGVNLLEREYCFLIEKALAGVLPSADDFPFSMHLIVDTISSNGSSALTALCGGSLALADAGVPLRCCIAGISVGMVTDVEKDFCEHEVGGEIYTEDTATAEAVYQQAHLLTDIQEIEDIHGDMDFKIAASEDGLAALQLDSKLPVRFGNQGGVTLETVKLALEQSRQPIQQVLRRLQEELSQKAPSECPIVEKTNINRENMSLIIGKDGTQIRKLEDETGVQLILQSTGDAAIYARTADQMKQAKKRILDLQGLTIHEGAVYEAKVVQLLDYGAYVELPNGFNVLLHISQLAHDRFASVKDILKEGQLVNVKCIGRDDHGNILLSRKELLE